MMLVRQGLPEEGEFLLCTVSNIQYHSVFATLDEFGGRTGMIHISEVAPGRIRNIRDYVKEGKKVVCKVLRINMEKGHIDLSLRRVTETQKRLKINQVKQEQKAEKIIETVAKQLKQKPEELFDKLAEQFVPKYGSLFPPFEALVKGEAKVTEWKLDAKTAKTLEEAIRSRIKESAVNITGELLVSSPEPDGVEVVRNALIDAQKAGGKAAKLYYLGAGRYSLKIDAEDYKKAESLLKSVVTTTERTIKGKGEASFVRKEK